MAHAVQKIVVFDLDETLGSFVELGIFWDAIEQYFPAMKTDAHFFQVLDLMPEFLRPHIIDIITYLIDQRTKQCVHKIMIYTNNQGPRTWVEMISKYFAYKLGTPVFDQIIAAFKVQGRVIEPGRTTHDKTVQDLINCTQIPPQTEICFLDDQHHPLMEDERVFYINAKPYTYTLPFDEMVIRYYRRFNPPLTEAVFVKRVTDFMKRYRFEVKSKDADEQRVDEIVSLRLFQYLKEFCEPTRQTAGTRKRKHQERSVKRKKRSKKD
jgi:hypothetical protein